MRTDKNEELLMQNAQLNRRWHVLYVNVRHEKKVLEKLREQGIESYLPLIKNTKQWSDRKKTVLEPLFTGYVFVKILPHELDKPLYFPGVLNYLLFEKQKAIVRQSEIDALVYLTENGYSLNPEFENVKVGAKVKLLLSSFKNETAIVNSIEGGIAVVYFEGLKQYIKVKAPLGALEITK